MDFCPDCDVRMIPKSSVFKTRGKVLCCPQCGQLKDETIYPIDYKDVDNVYHESVL